VGAVAVSAAKVANAAVVAIATKSKPIQNNLNKRRESSRRFFVSDIVTKKNIIFVANYSDSFYFSCLS
ncbi:MAG: hypothetical protein MKZ92_04300, partial [Pedosphaera sp.]|nr:hypothetical protein [Pedosphaera sp.]